MIRLGILAIGGPGWLGGVSYVEHLARCIAAAAGEKSELRPSLVVRPEALEGLSLHEPFLHLFRQIVFMLPPGVSPPASANARSAFCHGPQDLFRHVDCLFPLPWDVWESLPAVSWLPDFQHRFLPRFFSPAELQSRDRDIGRVAEKADLIVFSSRAAEAHFKGFYPTSSAETRVLPFRAFPSNEFAQGHPVETAKRYGLPDRFLLCCNQFWIHKDHTTLFRALARCREKGKSLFLACTGATEDYRHPGYFESLRRQVSEWGLDGQIKFLGTVPRRDQMQLIRCATAMVQPSLFEGWSTVVEDGRIFGKKIFLSDLDVHKEQDPPGAFFFKAGDAWDLAMRLEREDASLDPGPDFTAEAEAAEAADVHVATFARALEAIVQNRLRPRVAAKEKQA